MAKQIGWFKVIGTMEGIIFYWHRDYGYLARMKGAASAETRAAAAEFRLGMHSAKLLQDALQPLLLKSTRRPLLPRLLKLVMQIRKLDRKRPKGKRSTASAMALPEAKALLEGFDFNRESLLNTVLHKRCLVIREAGEIHLPDLMPARDVVFPEGSTYLGFTGARARIDFESGRYELQCSPTTYVAISSEPGTVLLRIPASGPGSGTELFLLQLEFFGEVRTIRYSLYMGRYTALGMI